MEMNKIGIDKLEVIENWLTWKFQIKQYLEASELFDVVEASRG